MSITPTPITPAIELLDFDPKNPRFMDVFGNYAQADNQAIERMLDEERIHELVGSIGQQGYFSGEPLLVSPHPEVAGRYVVVEGNRRLAALRLLLGMIPSNGLSPSLQDLIGQAKYRPDAVECLCFPQRRDILKYLGYRHISGPRRWGPLSKARYLADLIANFYSDLSPEEQYRAVARDIGSRRDYVTTLLAALNLYELARRENYFGLQRLEEKDISFSLVSTALSYSGIVDYLNLKGRDDTSGEKVNEAHLKNLFSWMFVQDDAGETVLKDSRRLKLLAAVVAEPRAIEVLHESRDLDRAYIHTKGPAATLTELLDEAHTSLMECADLVMGEVDVDESHMAQIERILKIADNLQLLALKSRRQRSRQEGGGNV